jgi:hypothetical protein
MKLLPNVYVTEVEDEYVAVATGKAAAKFKGMIRLNGTAAFIVERLKKNTTEEKLLSAVMAEYDVSEEKAKQNITNVIERLRSAGLLEE